MSKGRIIGIVSGKGGVGKTSLCVNLGIGLREHGKEVSVIDADFSASNLNVHLGRYEHPIKIQHVLNGSAKPSSAIFRHPTGLKAVASSNEIEDVEPELDRLKEITEHAAKESDYVLVDCPPGLDSTVESVIDACDELVIITIPTKTAALNAAQIIEKAKQMRKPILGTVINMSEEDPEKELIEREVEMMTESHIMSKIPHDTEMKKSIFEHTPLLLRSPLSDASLEIKELAANMEGVKYQRPSFPKIKRKLRRIKDTVSK